MEASSTHPHPAQSNTGWARQSSRRCSWIALRSHHVCSRPSDHLPSLLFSAFSSRLYDLSSLFRELQHESDTLGASLSHSHARKIDRELSSIENLLENEYSSRCSLYLLLSFPYIVFWIKRFYASVRSVIESLALDERWSRRVMERLLVQKNALSEGFGSLKFAPKEESLLLALQSSNLNLTVCKQIADCLGFKSSDYVPGFSNEVVKLKMECQIEEDTKHNNAEHYVFIRKCIDVLEKSIDEVKYELDRGHFTSHLCSESDDQEVVLEKSLSVDSMDHLQSNKSKGLLDQTSVIDSINDLRSYGKGGSLDKGLSINRIDHFMNKTEECSLDKYLSVDPFDHFKGDKTDSMMLKMACDVLHHIGVVPGSKDDYTKSLHVLQCLCENDGCVKHVIASENIIPSLVRLSEANDCGLRQEAISLLDVLATDQECQEIMLETELIEILVRSLARENEEAPRCIRLLCTLSRNKEVSRRISRMHSAILFLAAFIHNSSCTDNVNRILESLPHSDDNAVTMAELNIMEPLILRLQEGETESRVMMASTLGRLQLSNAIMTRVVEATLEALVKMVRSVDEDERKAGVMALENLSSVTAARRGLQESQESLRALDSLVRILGAGVRDSLKTRQGSATILANVWSDNALPMNDSHVVEAVKTYFGLLRPPTPMRLQVQLLQGLLNLAQCASSSSSASYPQQVMKDFNAFHCLLQLYLASEDPSFIPLRCLCLQLLTCLASKFPHEAASGILAQPTSIPRIASLYSDIKRESELKSALSFIMCLPSKDTTITKLLLQEHEFLCSLIKLLESDGNEEILAAVVAILLRFTLPSDKDIQAIAAKEGVIEVCVRLLSTSGVGGAVKEKAVKALCNFSMSTWELSKMEKRKKKKVGCFGCIFGGKKEVGKERVSKRCRVHGGKCSVEKTFCLVEAGALPLLLEAIREAETSKLTSSSMQAALLMAIGTLLAVQKGPMLAMTNGSTQSKTTKGEEIEQVSLLEACNVIEDAGGFGSVIALISSEVPQVQELASRLCEKLFGIPEYRSKYGAQAQPHIVTLLHTCPSNLRSLVGRLLQHLELLQIQSSTSVSTASTTTTISSSSSSLFGSSYKVSTPS